MQGRVKFIALSFAALFAIMGMRAMHLQVLGADEIIARANRRFDHNISLSPHRGTITDRKGQTLAISLDVKSVAANPRIIENPAQAARQISRILDTDRKSLQKKLSSERYFVWLKRHATPDEVAALKKLKLKGIGFYPEAKRFYPESDALANVLGFVGIDGKGLEGLELLYNRPLTGQEKQIQVQRDGMGRTIYARGLPEEGANKNGATLELTIDRRVQYIAYTELKRAVREHNARSGFVLITDPYTGGILAMASYPSFDPNRGSYRHLHGHTNQAVSKVYEPGSIVKPLWIGWGMEHAHMSPSQSVFCENGRYPFHRVTFHDHKKYGWLPVRDIVKYSSNIGMVKLTEPLSAQAMHHALKDYGFGARTGIDFPGDPRGLVPSAERWTSVDKAAISFGQGFACTGIQFITAFNSLVNGGYILKPHLASRTVNPAGDEEKFQTVMVRRPLSGKACTETVGIMKDVVLTGGTGENAYMENYQSFGKTGTGQKVDPLTGGYAKNAHTSSYAGGVMDASGRTAFTMLVTIDEPHPSYYASAVACPLFKRIATQCTNTLDIRPVITVAERAGSS